MAAGLGAAPEARAQAQGLLPAYGTDIRVGDLRDQFARSFQDAPKVATDRSWTFTPAIDISESYDSGVQTKRGFRKDYITRITPTLAGTITTRRIDATINYSPSYSFYALNGSESGISHNLNAAATVTAVEDLLFVDLRGYAASQPLLGGYSTPGDTGGRANEVQTTSFSVSPYLRHRFGDLATARLAYTLSHNSTSSENPNASTLLGGGVNGNYMSHQQSLNIASGPDFGRIQAGLDATAIQYVGQGVYKGAHTETAAVTAGYALTRTFTVTGSLGHENIVYGPGGPRPITGMTWSGGFRWAPNADSVVSASYGHQQGATSVMFDGSYAPTARLRFSARYSQGVGSSLQNLQNALAGTTVGTAGISVDRVTGAPVQLDSYLGQQPGIYRTTSASLSAVLLLDRDVLTLTVEKTERKLLGGGSATATGIGSNDGVNTSLAWQHSLTEALTTSTYLQYGVRSVPGQGSNTTTSGSISATYALSQTLSTNLLLSHSETTGPSFGLAPARDLVVVGVHKGF